MKPRVGQPVKYYECEGGDPRAAQIVMVDAAPPEHADLACVCLAAWCHKTKAYVEVAHVPFVQQGDSTPYWTPWDDPLDEAGELSDEQDAPSP